MQNTAEPFFESLEVEKALGWRVFGIPQEERAKTVSSGETREIIELRNGKLIYTLKGMQELSAHEARLLRRALDEHRGTNQSFAAGFSGDALGEFCKRNNIELDGAQTGYLRLALSSIASPAGALSGLLRDDSLEEIAVIGTGRSKPVRVFDPAFGWVETNLYFSSPEEIKNIINALAAGVGRRITFQSPQVNAVLADGSRLNACIEPASVSGPCITIRKFRKEAFTPTELINLGTVSAEQMAFLWLAMQADCSVLACGNTGSGKTTLLGGLFNFVPKNERVIIVEETPEIRVPHAHCVRLTTAEGIELGMQGLIVNTLRMRPDRVLVGEIRNQNELGAFIDTLLSGQGKGSYATFHAQSAVDAILRLKNLGTLESDLLALGIILVQRRWSTYRNGECREIRKLSEICSVEQGKNGVKILEIFSYDSAKNKFVFRGIGEKVCAKIIGAFGFSKKTLAQELSARKEFLLSLKGKKSGEFFDAVQNYGKNRE